MKIGLEIHFQLSGNKLFCSCNTEGTDLKDSFVRKLTPVMGEMGKMDTAVEYETIRNRDFVYKVSSNSCLVEKDEEPPHPVNMDALKTSIAISKALNCKILDYISFMRKIVVDGSNTSGFQRTGIVGMDGSIKTSRGNVRISTITLEEDACRKLSEKNGIVEYSLDRLGIPLIEISTEPDIIDPEHALETAKAIGHYVMSMPNFRGEVDSIRQDVNFSMGFGRVEIKGVSKLSFIKDTIEYEIKRQNSLDAISHKLSEQFSGIGDFIDITGIFENTGSSMVKKAIATGKSVMCAKVSKCNGLMKSGDYKLGREFADIAKNIGIGGLMHSDEFPAYGLSGEELEKIYHIAGKNDEDAVIVVLANKSDIEKLKPLLDERLSNLLKMHLEETRAATPSGETRYLRPLAGKERMYPETDIPAEEITPGLMEIVEKMVPKSMDDTIKEIIQKFGLSRVEAESLINNNLLSLFKSLAGSSSNPHIISRLLLQTIPELEKKTGKKLSQEQMVNIFGNRYQADIDPRGYHNHPGILEMSEREKWNRTTTETALTLNILDNIPLSELEKREELKMLNNNEIKQILEELIKDGNVTEKNLIFLFKGKTKQSFNPSDVIKMFISMQNKK